ncbi:MAG: zinc-binding dehydrogenase [Micropruina glycogenica]
MVVTDPSEVQLALANAYADLTVDVGSTRIAQAQRELGMREGFDVALEMSGSPQAVAELIDNMNHGGKVAMLGLPKNPYPIDWGKVITHMLTIKGIYGREMFETWYLMTSMLSTSPTLADAVRSVITHRFPAEQWQQAFDVARSGNCGKVILDWS